MKTTDVRVGTTYRSKSGREYFVCGFEPDGRVTWWCPETNDGATCSLRAFVSRIKD